jgi:hypothetical protein
MTLLPIVERELRAASRGRNAFLARVLAAGAAIAFGAWNLVFPPPFLAPGMVSVKLFDQLSFLAFLFCLLAGPLLTADAISQERREGTLGLLFLTDLHGYDVALGKAAAASIPALCGVLALAPVLTIPLLLGGIGLAEVGRVFLALAGTMALSLAVGLTASAYSRQARTALASTVFVLFLLTVIVPWALASSGGGSLGPVLGSCSPYLFYTSAHRPPRPGEIPFPTQLAVTALLTFSLVALASWRVARAWRDPDTAPVLVRWATWCRRWSLGDATERLERRRALLKEDPLLWLGLRYRLKQWAVFGLVLVWVAGTALALFHWRSQQLGVVVAFLSAQLVQAALKCLLASEASHRWAEERRGGALELLLTTPLGARGLLRGHFHVLRRIFGLPAAILVAAKVLACSLYAQESPVGESLNRMLVLSTVVFVWDLHTLAWVGTWLGMACRRSDAAQAGALGCILGLPWVLFIGAGILGGGWFRHEPDAFVWFGYCAVINATFYGVARYKVAARFRLPGAEPGR